MRKIFTLTAAALASSAFAAIDSVPESAEVQTWYFNAQIVWPAEDVINKEISVAIDGNDFYFKGIDSSTDAWVKGTLADGVYTFESWQDLGSLWGYAISFAGYDGSDATLATATMTDNVMAFNTGIGILYTDYPDSAPAIWWEAGAKMSAEPQEYIEPVITDQTADMPYKNNFDSENKRSQVAMFTKSGFGWDWGADWTTNNWYAACHNDGSEQGDDYLIFPGLPLEAGKTYVLHFDAQSSSSSNWQNYEVLMGAEGKISMLTEQVIPSSYCYSVEWENVEKEFSVAESGTYYIAIHNITSPWNGYFSVDNFGIEEQDLEKPEPAENLSISTGRNGELEANLTFTLPLCNIGGHYYDIDKKLDYTVSRGDVVIAQGQEAPGALTFAYDNGEGLTNGFVTYKVVVSDGNHVSKEATATAYVGIDYPVETEYVEISREGNQLCVAWVPVTRGANGGFVGAKYNVYECSARYQRGEKLNAEPLTECKYVFDYDIESGEQRDAWFCVTVVNEIDETYGAYESYMVGAPYELPYTDSFAADDTHIWMFDGEGGSAYLDRWGSYSSDGDDAALCFYIWNNDVEESSALAGTGKICTAAHAQLSFDYKADVDTELAIMLGCDSEEDVFIVTDEAIKFEAGSEGTIVIPDLFEQCLDHSYVQMLIAAKISATYQYLFIDNLKIEVADPTAIRELNAEHNGQIYSIDGKHISGRPAAGLYIQNGQKMMVK